MKTILQGEAVEALVKDIRFSFRSILKNPGFATAAIASLALGIGANTAIFSVVNAFLLRPLPIRAPQEMVEIYTSNREGNPYAPSSYSDFIDIREQKDLFSGAAAYMLVMTNLSHAGSSEVVLGELVTGNFFSVLGVEPAKGRTFLPEEDRDPGTHPVVVLSDGLWHRRFGADPSILGRTVTLSGLGYTVVGIAPPAFKGLIPGLSADVWLPSMMLAQVRPEQPDDLKDRNSRGFFIKARLRDGVTPAQAQAAMTVLGNRLATAFPATNEGLEISVVPTSEVHIHPKIDRALVPASVLLMAVVGLVLLIACTNVASLLLARASTRRKEIAMRLALGAGRGQIIRQLLTESFLLALVGGAVGLLLSFWLVRLLGSYRPPLPVPLAIDLSVDARVLVFTLLLSLATGVVFGLVPALQASKPALVPALKGEGGGGGRRRRFGLRQVLVVTQVAVSLLLLIGAGLFVRSLQEAQSLDPGFDTEHAAIVGLDAGVQGYAEPQGRELFRQILEQGRSLPGVRSVTLTDRLPLDLGFQATQVFPDAGAVPADAEEGFAVDFARIGPDYFRTLGVPLLGGRDFSPADSEAALPVAIVSEAAAKLLWPGESPIGKRFRRGERQGSLVEVVGLARDAKVRSLGEEPRPFLYVPFPQSYESAMQIVVRTDGDPARVLEPLRGRIRELDGDLQTFASKTMRQHLGIALFPVRMAAGLLGAFGLVALLLASVGIYGVMSYFVAQRTREVGIRMALGAEGNDVLRMVILEGMRVVGVGMGLGLVLALAVAPLLSSFMLGVSSFDAVTFLGISLLLGAVALAAIFVPARRATRVDPLVALAAP